MSGERLVEFSSEEAEKFLLSRVEDAKDDPVNSLWQLVRFYNITGRHDRAMDGLRRILALLSDAERSATCLLAMGQTMEEIEDYEAAARYYREGLTLEPTRRETWYFLHNNLGFSLNTMGQVQQGELYCRKAIEIDGTRPNGHKNLGLALAGQGRIREAAQSFVTATRVNAADRRSYDHLALLLAEHPELKPEWGADAEWCRQAVGDAAENAERSKPRVHRGFWKHALLLRLRLRHLFGRRRIGV